MICVCGIYYLYMNRHVKFQDKNKAYEISRTIGPNVNPENVKYKDVYAIKELNIGQLGKYDTLEDIKLCKNLVTICRCASPLSKDETEVESLCKAFPNAKIFISEDKVQNIDIKEE